MTAHLYAVTLNGAAVLAAEIEELIWFDADKGHRRSLAPLVEDVILPLVRQSAGAP